MNHLTRGVMAAILLLAMSAATVGQLRRERTPLHIRTAEAARKVGRLESAAARALESDVADGRFERSRDSILELIEAKHRLAESSAEIADELQANPNLFRDKAALQTLRLAIVGSLGAEQTMLKNMRAQASPAAMRALAAAIAARRAYVRLLLEAQDADATSLP